jgi:DNA-binding NarL/FixJ family response regulator
MTANQPRALIVEDSPAWQEILAEILTDEGLAVDVASSLDAAVASLSRAPHRLAVVDLSLEDRPNQPVLALPHGPGNEDGLRVLAAVRRHDPGCVPLLLTGYATVEVAVSALTELGAYTCLRKEAFRRAEFRALIRKALAVAVVASTTAADPAESRRPIAAGGASTTAAQADARVPAVLLVEDDAAWRSILAELLADAGYRVSACPSYGEAAGHLRRGACDLAVVDLGLANSLDPRANRDGFRVLAGAQAAGIPAIVVSGLVTAADVERVYSEYGVYACLEKQAFERAAFTRTIGEAVAAGQAGRGQLAALTPRERDVLALLVGGLANKEIAHDLVISTNTVKRYLKSIFEKLAVESRAGAVAVAMGAGMKAQPRRSVE